MEVIILLHSQTDGVQFVVATDHHRISIRFECVFEHLILKSSKRFIGAMRGMRSM